MKLVFLTVSSRLPSWLEELGEDYVKKLAYWVGSELKVIKAPTLDREASEKKIKIESEALSDFLKDDDFVILCDENGKEFDSKKFAQFFERTLGSGKKRIVLAIGGSFGVNSDLKKRANLLLKLSPFTFTHHLALAVAMEQTYRAMTILKGTQYHNG